MTMTSLDVCRQLNCSAIKRETVDGYKVRMTQAWITRMYVSVLIKSISQLQSLKVESKVHSYQIYP